MAVIAPPMPPASVLRPLSSRFFIVTVASLNFWIAAFLSDEKGAPAGSSSAALQPDIALTMRLHSLQRQRFGLPLVRTA